MSPKPRRVAKPAATSATSASASASARVAPPDVGPLRVGKLPRVDDRSLPSGLRLVTVSRPTVPIVELRLRLDTARGARVGNGAVERVVGETMLSGTADRSAMDVAAELQGLGGWLSVSAGLEQVTVIGSVLSANLAPFMRLLGDVLAHATYPKDEVDVHRGRVAQELAIARSQPGAVASEAMLGRLYPGHPYGRPMPAPEDAASLTAADVRRFHRDRIGPADGALVAVGDVRPSRMFDLAGEALGEWGRARTTPKPMPAPAPPEPGAIQIIHRPGAVQTCIRLAGPATSRHDPLHPAFLVAHTAFGGGFSSRLNHNLREDKGYTYGAVCGIDHRLRASHVVVQTDVATEVTAAALAEIQYELARMVTAPLTDDEIVSAKRFRNGQLAISLQSQVGFAAQMSALLPHGLGVDYVKRLPPAVDAVTADTALDAARRYLAPSRLVTVLVGDAEAIAADVESLAPVTVVSE